MDVYVAQLIKKRNREERRKKRKLYKILRKINHATEK